MPDKDAESSRLALMYAIDAGEVKVSEDAKGSIHYWVLRGRHLSDTLAADIAELRHDSLVQRVAKPIVGSPRLRLTDAGRRMLDNDV